MWDDLDLIQSEGDSTFHLLKQTHKGSLSCLLLTQFQIPLASQLPFIQILIWTNRFSTKHHMHSPQRSLWRGSVCICPLTPLLAAMAGQSLRASAGNSPEPYMKYLCGYTHARTHARMHTHALLWVMNQYEEQHVHTKLYKGCNFWFLNTVPTNFSHHFLILNHRKYPWL